VRTVREWLASIDAEPNHQRPTELFIVQGKSFGDGRHETTQLCLLALGYLIHSRIRPRRTLDFGTGNGVLGIAAAKAGSLVEAVDSETDALDEARVNARLNGVSSQFDLRTALGAAPLRR
jgi:ribosomal protein L11 methyltransferase